MLLGALGTFLGENMLAGKGIVKAGNGVVWAGDEVFRLCWLF